MVDLIPIESKDKSIQSCFKECLYAVPEFQRPYSWEHDKQLTDYWSDVILARSDMFFGATVTYISEARALFRNTYSLIDGQQRITTSAIALSVMRDYFHKLGEEAREQSNAELAELFEDQAVVTQGYLVARDDDGHQWRIIQRNEPMFAEVIQRPDAIPSQAKWDHSARLIGAAREFFERKTAEALADLAPLEKFERLKSMRNNILSARVIQVEMNSEEDATLVFETLNHRGASLLVADLVKNLLVRSAGDNADDRKTISDRWQRMMGLVIGEKGKAEYADSFIWSSWNSRRPAVTMRSLYKAIKAHCERADAAAPHLEYLAELEKDALPYALLEGASTEFPKPAHGQRIALALPAVQDSISALALFNVSVANSAVMAIVRGYDEARMKEGQLIEAMNIIEKFHFQFTQLAKSGSTGGTRGRYNKFAIDLGVVPNSAAVGAAIKDLKSKLHLSLPDRDVATAGFKGLLYAPGRNLTNAQKSRGSAKLIKYVLLTIAQYEGTLPDAQRGATWSIEHVRPQSVATEKLTDPVFNIGNLILLPPKENNRVANKPFEQKRATLAKVSVSRDKVFKSWIGDKNLTELTDENIGERAEALAALAVDHVWAI